MTSWDEQVLLEPEAEDFFDELQEEFAGSGQDIDIEGANVALEDVVMIALKQSARGDEDYNLGLAAASIVAIWSGAPYSVSELVNEHPILREGIGKSSEILQECAAQLLEAEFDALEDAGEEIPEGLETYLEALS